MLRGQLGPRPQGGFARFGVEVGGVHLADGRPVVVAGDAEGPRLAQRVDAGVGLRAVAHEVAETPDGVYRPASASTASRASRLPWMSEMMAQRMARHGKARPARGSPGVVYGAVFRGALDWGGERDRRDGGGPLLAPSGPGLPRPWWWPTGGRARRPRRTPSRLPPGPAAGRPGGGVRRAPQRGRRPGGDPRREGGPHHERQGGRRGADPAPCGGWTPDRGAGPGSPGSPSPPWRRALELCAGRARLFIEIKPGGPPAGSRRAGRRRRAGAPGGGRPGGGGPGPADRGGGDLLRSGGGGPGGLAGRPTSPWGSSWLRRGQRPGVGAGGPAEQAARLGAGFVSPTTAWSTAPSSARRERRGSR